MSKIIDFDVILDMYKLASELSHTNISLLYELSHYLVDNLISKLCIIIARQRGIIYYKTTKAGKKRTYDFDKLYKSILIPHYNVPNYDLEVKKLHEHRNVFTHDLISINYSIRKNYVRGYITIAEKILRATGIIDKKEEITRTNFIKDQYLDEIINVNLSKFHVQYSSDYVGKDKILGLIKTAESEFENILKQRINPPDLEMRIYVCPINYKSEMFQIHEDLKHDLIKNAFHGPLINNRYSAKAFEDLNVNRDGFYYINNQDFGGNIFIKKDGIIMYSWDFNDIAKKILRRPIVLLDNEDSSLYTGLLLPFDEMCGFFIAFLNFIHYFSRRMNYYDDILIIFKVKGIKTFGYSKITTIQVDKSVVKKYQHLEFDPIEEIYKFHKSSNKEGKIKLIKNIFNEILLGYGDSNGFEISKEFQESIKG